MSAQGAVVRDTLDLGKHAFAVAFERERVHAPQHLPVGFRNGAWRGAGSFIVEAERERHGCRCFFHFPRRQSGNAIADIALGYRLKIVEVCCAGMRQTVLLRQHDLCGNAADCRCDGRNGDRVQYCYCRLAGKDQHWPLLVGCLERVPADFTSIHDAPQSCSLSQTSNSPGATGLRV